MAKVYYNEGDQDVVHAPIDREGRVTQVGTATYSIVDLRKSEADVERTVQASTAASVDSYTQSLTAAAGPAQANNRQITVASTVGLVEGHTYLLQEGGQREPVIAHRIASSTLVYAETDLRFDYTTSATLDGVELTGTFPSAEAADETEVEDGGGPYWVVWDYEINGRPYLVGETIWLTRYALPPFVDARYVLEAFPSLARSLRGDGPTVSQAIRVSHDDYMAELEAAGLPPEYTRPGRFAMNTVRKKAIEYLLRWKQTDTDTAEADRWEDKFNQAVAHIHTGKMPHGSARIDPVTDTADAGSDQVHGNAYIGRS